MGFSHFKWAYPRLEPLTSMCVCVWDGGGGVSHLLSGSRKTLTYGLRNSPVSLGWAPCIDTTVMLIRQLLLSYQSLICQGNIHNNPDLLISGWTKWQEHWLLHAIRWTSMAGPLVTPTDSHTNVNDLTKSIPICQWPHQVQCQWPHQVHTNVNDLPKSIPISVTLPSPY